VLANPIVTSEYDTKFTAAITTNEGIYIGTEGFGVLKTTVSNVSVFEEIHPDGPLRNNTFSVEADFGSLWATYGDYTSDYNAFPLREYGLSHLQNEQWINIPYDSIFNSRNLNAISINPLNPSQVFISSFKDGILEINDNEPIIRYDQTNSGLESLILPNNPNFVGIRVSGTSFDSNGLLWSISSLIQKPLKSFDPSINQWRSYTFSELIPEAFDNLGFKDLIIEPSGTIFLTTFEFGVIGFNPNNGAIKNIDKENGNLPFISATAIALDKRNQLWIGTTRGLRVLFNTSNFFSDENVSTEPIIILEDGIPKDF